ncbi:SbtR family transcriptional regulator [Amnibacterium kyonggiense]
MPAIDPNPRCTTSTPPPSPTSRSRKPSRRSPTCDLALYAASGALLVDAQAAGTARADVGIDDVLRFIMGVTSAPARSCEQRDRFVRLAVDAVSST